MKESMTETGRGGSRAVLFRQGCRPLTPLFTAPADGDKRCLVVSGHASSRDGYRFPAGVIGAGVRQPMRLFLMRHPAQAFVMSRRQDGGCNSLDDGAGRRHKFALPVASSRILIAPLIS